MSTTHYTPTPSRVGGEERVAQCLVQDFTVGIAARGYYIKVCSANSSKTYS